MSRIWFLFCLLMPLIIVLKGNAQNDSNQNKRDGFHISINGRGISTDSTRAEKRDQLKIFFNEVWRFKNSDSDSFSAVHFDDSDWTKTSKGEEVDLSDSVYGVLTGITWFRTWFVVDSAEVNIIHCLYVEQDGSAAEIFIDGELIGKYGTVGHDLKSEKIQFSMRTRPLPVFFSKPGKHLLAIRYSDFHNRKFAEMKPGEGHGFEVEFAHLNDELDDFFDTGKYFPLIFLLSVYLTLGAVHLIMFFFFRDERPNFFFGLYCTGIALVLSFAYYVLTDADYGTYKFMARVAGHLGPVIVLPLIAFYHTIYYKRLLKIFWIMIGLYAGVEISGWFGWSIENLFLGFLIIFIIYELFRVHIRSLIKGKDGALILGMGIFYLPLILIIIIIVSLVISKSKTAYDVGYLYGQNFFKTAGMFLVYSLALSIPFTITLFLSRNFARINRRLLLQVDEIRLLSEQTLKHETEKKKILEEQNIILETKVQQRTQELSEKNKLISIKNKEITDNLNYAKRIQSAILPGLQEIKDAFRECFVFYQPKDIVSGDFYAFFRKENKFILAAVDCTGHGVSGAFMSMIGNSALNQIINTGNLNSPSAILDRLNENIIRSLNQKTGSSNDGMDVALACFDLNTNWLEYAGANRPLWLIRNKELIIFSPDKMPVGGMQFGDKRPFTNHVYALKADDCIYMFSDGFADQFGGENGKKLMTRQLKELLLNINYLSMSDQQAYLQTFLNNWKGLHEQLDDILVIGVRI